jgi:uncharacterized membrane protein YqgA involved in biofilm formation
LTGTFLNVATVLVGGSLGLLVGRRLPERVRETVMVGIGLISIILGVKMSLETSNTLILLGSTILGGFIGEIVGIQKRLDGLGQWFQKKLNRNGEASSRFSEGFVTASLIFCVGPMTITGSIQDGMSGDFELLAVKSAMDGFSSIAFAAAFGPGVLLAGATVLVYQGGISLGASALSGVMTEAMVHEMTAAGGLMILGIGLVILDVSRPRVASFLPALVIAPMLWWLFGVLDVP